ncbi:MAG: FkbM family methyltransferase [Planctomycetota bacterium]
MQTRHPQVTDAVAYSLYRERYESHEMRVLGDKIRPDDVLLELGCGMGFIGIACAKKLASGRLVGVEANAELISLIEENYALNGLEIELIHGAISDTPGEVEIDFADDFRYSGVGIPGAVRTVKVPAVLLPELLEKYQPSGMVLDVEGAEVRVLDEGVDLSSVRFIAVEVHADRTGDAAISRMVAALFGHGFVLDVVSTSTPVLFFYRPEAA